MQRAGRLRLFNTAADVKVLKVRSSKPEVMKATRASTYDKIKLTPLKAGKSTLTIAYKFRGKSYTTKATYTVVGNPLESLKLNGKKISLSQGYPSSYRYCYKKWSKGTAKLKVNPSKGWSVKSMAYSHNYGKSEKVKNGASFKTPKGKYTAVDITMKSKAGKTFKFTVSLDRE